MTIIKYKNAQVRALFPTPVYETDLGRKMTKTEESYFNSITKKFR